MCLPNRRENDHVKGVMMKVKGGVLQYLSPQFLDLSLLVLKFL